MENLLTPSTLWQDVNVDEQLNINVVSSEEGEYVHEKVYFTGRTFGEKSTRIYAEIVRKSQKKAVIVIGDYDKPVCSDELDFWAQSGFVAMAIDYSGNGKHGGSTVYTEEVAYAKADSNASIFDVEQGCEHNKLYEYAFNTMRAITYLTRELKVKSVSVVCHGKGFNVGAIVLGVDKRVISGAVLQGNLYVDHPDTEFTSDNLDEELSRKEKAQVWTTGLAPQSYTLNVTVPLYVVCGVNCQQVNVGDLCWAFERLNKDSRLLVLPQVANYLPDVYLEKVAKFLKSTASDCDVKTEVTNTEDGVEVMLHTAKKDVSLWYCRNYNQGCYNWVSAPLTKTEGGYVSRLETYGDCHVGMFALQGGEIPLSTVITEFDVSETNVKQPTNVLFTGSNELCFMPFDNNRWHGSDVFVSKAKGYLDIVGAKSRSMVTFAVSDKAIKYNRPITITLDVCSNKEQTLSVYVITDYGKNNVYYTQDVLLTGDGKWQRVTLEKEEFRRTSDGKVIAPEDVVNAIAFVAEDEVIINNVFLV